MPPLVGRTAPPPFGFFNPLTHFAVFTVKSYRFVIIRISLNGWGEGFVGYKARQDEMRSEEISMLRVGVAAVIPSVAAGRAEWLVAGDGDGAITGEWFIVNVFSFSILILEY